mgnify:CR=1 FL=1
MVLIDCYLFLGWAYKFIRTMVGGCGTFFCVGRISWSMGKRKGMGGHQGSDAETVVWITPPHVLAALGRFDLDPCSSVGHPWPCAVENWVFPAHDGLREAWHGRVWLNPPYGQECGKWLRKLSEHGCGTALVFARTETEMFQRWVFPAASGVLFLSGRLHFHYPDGRRAVANAGAPSCLIAYGESDAAVLRSCGLHGAFFGKASMVGLSVVGTPQLSLF